MRTLIVIIISLMFGVIFAQVIAVNNNTELNTSDTVIGTECNQLRFMHHRSRMRSYLVHVPPSYDDETDVPLVILLHGACLSGWHICEQSDMNKKADEEGFIVVYPNGAQGLLISFLNRVVWRGCKGLCWNAGFSGAGPYLLKVDDVGFIDAIIERMEKEYAINSSRIYIGGFSLGAFLTYYAGSRLSDKVAAIASVAGSIGVKTPDYSLTIPESENPLPVIIFHGLKDKGVPYEPIGQGWRLFSVNESVKFWVENNNCNETPIVSESENGNVTIKIYENGTNGSEVILYTVNNGEHWWFGGSLKDEFYDPYQEISATDLMWEFFEQYPKNK